VLRSIGSDPYNFPGSVFYSEQTKLTGRENLINYAFWLGPDGLTDKENQVKMYRKRTFGSWKGLLEINHFLLTL
jgi:hypothetical protein